MTLDIVADDDAQYTSGTNAPMANTPPPVTITVSKYRGPGAIAIAESRPKLTALKGGKPDEPYSGHASTTVKFATRANTCCTSRPTTLPVRVGADPCVAGPPPS